ncbi:unnamed protein product [Lactuca saligna]|uniref:Uncharacterized protein n=1 Tax=Lactuca saligna TaxID=75948 RepID=A0AA35YHV8_LACSI|nr:unnamed protein product [Lactuca saligna]
MVVTKPPSMRSSLFSPLLGFQLATITNPNMLQSRLGGRMADRQCRRRTKTKPTVESIRTLPYFKNRATCMANNGGRQLIRDMDTHLPLELPE